MRVFNILISNKQKKRIYWILGVFVGLLITSLTVVYIKREQFLQQIIACVITKADKDFGLKVHIGEARFSDFNSVSFKNTSIVPKDKDSLLFINNLSVSVKILPLLLGDVKLSDIKLSDGKLNVVLKDSTSNLDFILRRKKKNKDDTNGKLDLSRLANNLLNQFLYKIPDNMIVKNFMVQLTDNDTAKVQLFTTLATINNQELKSEILVDNRFAVWHINGKLKPNKKQLDIAMFADHGKVELPYLNNKIHGKVSFDTVKTQMLSAGFVGDDFKISGSWAVKNLTINHARIASNDIVLPDAHINTNMLFGANYVALDSTSTIYMKKARIHPYVKYTLKPHKIYELKLTVDEQNAQDLIEAFPQGLFDSLEGMQVGGKIAYHLDFSLDSSQPDSVRFNSKLIPHAFRVMKWGKTNILKINSPFVYTPYEHGKPMRDIFIGQQNPNFTSLEFISSNFKNALLTSEDPSFFTHNGFVPEAIRKSIAVDFKEKKFKRGGSTISMQLVKNVFLNRNKTLSRKIEEILIVWLMESDRLVSKERMLEVYFNIVEMGPNVYGIGEASKYYFGKHPFDLTIGEGLFLASIMPKPKASLYRFNSDGTLKEFLYPHFKYIGNIMARRGLVAQDSTGSYGFYTVRLKESLRYLLPKSTLRADTILRDSDEELTPMDTNYLPNMDVNVIKIDTVSKKK